MLRLLFLVRWENYNTFPGFAVTLSYNNYRNTHTKAFFGVLHLEKNITIASLPLTSPQKPKADDPGLKTPPPSFGKSHICLPVLANLPIRCSWGDSYNSFFQDALQSTLEGDLIYDSSSQSAVCRFLLGCIRGKHTLLHKLNMHFKNYIKCEVCFWQLIRMLLWFHILLQMIKLFLFYFKV